MDDAQYQSTVCIVLLSFRGTHYNFTALEMPPKGFPIVQFDMHVAEDIGLKIDILSQRGLGTIDEAVKIIEKTELKLISLIFHCLKRK
jgi:DNA polymerase III alpha subunit